MKRPKCKKCKSRKITHTVSYKYRIEPTELVILPGTIRVDYSCVNCGHKWKKKP